MMWRLELELEWGVFATGGIGGGVGFMCIYHRYYYLPIYIYIIFIFFFILFSWG